MTRYFVLLNRTAYAWFAILLLFLLPFVAGCAPGAGQVEPTPIPTPIVPEKPTYTVQQGTVSNVLELRGRVSPVRQQDLFFRTAGHVNAVNVKRGDTVKAGDVLAYLGERETLEAGLADAQLEVLKAEQALDTLFAEADLKSAEAHLAYLEAKQDLVEAEKARVNKDYRRGSDASIATAKADFQAAQFAAEQAEQAYMNLSDLPEEHFTRLMALAAMENARRKRDLALATVTFLEGKPSEEEILQAEVELAIARAELEAARREYERLKDGPDPFDVMLAEASLSKAQANHKKALASLENLEIRAPFDGEILSVGISAGVQATAFQNVISIADPSDLEITLLPSADELNQLSVGQSAVVRLAGQPGIDRLGEVRQMSLTSLTTTGEQSRDQTVRITVNAGGDSLALGELATVVIQLEEREDVLWLPPAALRIFQGRDFVIVQDGEVQRRIDVRLGLRSKDRVEILEGLAEGQVVIGP